MKSETWGVLSIMLLAVYAFAAAHQRSELKQEAVNRGFAEWKIIPDTNETEFKWKETLDAAK